MLALCSCEGALAVVVLAGVADVPCLPRRYALVCDVLAGVVLPDSEALCYPTVGGTRETLPHIDSLCRCRLKQAYAHKC